MENINEKKNKFIKILFIILSIAFFLYGIPNILTSIKASTGSISFYIGEGDSLGSFGIVLLLVPVFQALVYSLPLVVSIFIYFKGSKKESN